jgi:hypothetical protein
MAKMQLPPDFSEFLSLLNSEKVEYLLLGGYAIAYYGVPRATGDMDLWVNPEPANTERLVAALRRFGLDDPAIIAARFQQTGQVFRIGFRPLRIELLTSVSGLEFRAAYARRRIVRLNEVEVTLMDLEDLRANKLAAGRRKDLDDLDQLPPESRG